MRTWGLLAAVMGLIGIFAVSESVARADNIGPAGGWGTESPYSRMYDPKTVDTVSGEVMSVDQVLPTRGMSPGVHLTLKTDTETISVHLGPEWLLEKEEMKIAPGDTIEVTGSRVTVDGKPAIIAAEVRKGETTLRLRNENGVPVWSGGRRR